MRKIVVVDDDITNLKIAEKVLVGHFKPILLISGAQLIKFLSKNTPDLILLDINMPDMNGYEVFQEIKRIPSAAEVPIIFLTANTDIASEVKGLEMGAVDFIIKPFVKQTMLNRINTHLELSDYRNKSREIKAEKTGQMELRQDELMIALSGLVNSRNGKHLRRVAYYTELILQELFEQKKFDDIVDIDYIYDVKRGSLLHEIGEIGIVDVKLLNPLVLNSQEKENMCHNFVSGSKILEEAISIFGEESFLVKAKNIACFFNEKWNGEGSVNGLQGEKIPLEARIFSVAHTYDELTIMKNDCQGPVSHDEAVSLIIGERGKAFDSQIIEVLEKIQEKFAHVLGEFLKGDR